MSVVLEEIIEKIESLSEVEQERLIEAVNQRKRIKAAADRREFIHSLKGKYKDGLSSVDEFIARKQEDIEREDKGWQPKAKATK